MRNWKKMLHISGLSFALLLAGACSKYLDINTDPNSPESPGDLDLLLADITATTSYNLVGGGNWTRYGARWIQHVADNSAPPSEDTYRINTSDANNEWQYYSYASVLINCKKLIEYAEAVEQWHHVGIAKVLMAHNYALLTDFWGDIPFSEALGRAENGKPKFDNQQAVYAGIQQLLDEGIEALARESNIGVGGGDLYLGGDNQAWIRVAYALKARYYMHLTNAPGVDPQQQAQLALGALGKAMTGPADEARFNYTIASGQEAPWNQWIDKFATTIRVGKFMVDLLKAKNDPRLPIIANQNNAGEYVGHQNGAPQVTPLAAISAIGDYYLDPDFDVPLMTYVEQKFIEAEALWRLGNTDEARAAYDEAIRTHMNELSGKGELGTNISSAQMDAYIAANPLNNLEDLIVQKYIAAFVVSSFEAYNDYRRTGYPSALQPAINTLYNQIPTRMIYTDTEVNNNVENVPPGVTLTSKVWWDGD